MTQAVRTDWLFTARGRAGFAADNWLLYGTGGVAVTELKHNAIFADTFLAAENINNSATKVGYAVGAGLEYGFLSNWTLRAEYLYVNFGNVSSTTLLGPTAVTSACNCTNMFHNVNLSANIVRLGVNYRFGGPVVARY